MSMSYTIFSNAKQHRRNSRHWADVWNSLIYPGKCLLSKQDIYYYLKTFIYGFNQESIHCNWVAQIYKKKHAYVSRVSK